MVKATVDVHIDLSRLRPTLDRIVQVAKEASPREAIALIVEQKLLDDTPMIQEAVLDLLQQVEPHD